MPPRHVVLTALYAAFNRRDIDEALRLMHPQVDWPNGMEGGRVEGRDGVRGYWRRQWGLIDPHVEPLRIKDDAMGHLVVDVHQVIRDPSGKILKDQIVQHVYSFRNGLVARMEIRKSEPEPAHEGST